MEGNTRASSACPVPRPFASFPSNDNDGYDELVDVHQSPVGSRCTSAYLRLLTGEPSCGLCSPLSSAVSWLARMLSTSRGTGAL